MIDFKDEFNGAEDEVKEIIINMVASMYYRNGMRHEDGSMGEVTIKSPAQLRDALTFAYSEGHEDALKEMDRSHD